MNVDYFFLDTDNQTHDFSEDAMTRLRKFSRYHCFASGFKNNRLSFRHGQIDNRLVHSELFRDVHRLLDRRRGMLEEIARKHNRYCYTSVIGM